MVKCDQRRGVAPVVPVREEGWNCRSRSRSRIERNVSFRLVYRRRLRPFARLHARSTRAHRLDGYRYRIGNLPRLANRTRIGRPMPRDHRGNATRLAAAYRGTDLVARHATTSRGMVGTSQSDQRRIQALRLRVKRRRRPNAFAGTDIERLRSSLGCIARSPQLRDCFGITSMHAPHRCHQQTAATERAVRRATVAAYFR